SWKTEDIPERFIGWTKSWKQINPDYAYVLWTDISNRQLVESDFPWFLSTYDNLPRAIHRADAVRYCYMYKYGGIYADIDVEALKPMSNLFERLRKRELAIRSKNWKFGIDPVNQETWSLDYGNKYQLGSDIDLVIPLMSGDINLAHNIPNAWLASKPGHSFWIWTLLSIQEKFQTNSHLHEVEGLTGPVALLSAFNQWINDHHEVNQVHVKGIGKKETISFAPPGVIFPYDWYHGNEHRVYCSAESDSFNADKCKSIVANNDSYSITYWATPK
ncbi:hypothetical protein HK096_004705, partial [Nowakowskiella sp. JEL0078]